MTEATARPRDPIAALLRTLRTRSGLSLQALGARVSASAPHLYNIETGRRLPSQQLAARIGRALGVDPEALRAWVQAAGRSDWQTTRRAAGVVDQFVRDPAIAELMSDPGLAVGISAPAPAGALLPAPRLPAHGPAAQPLRRAAAGSSGPARVLIPLLEAGSDPDAARAAPSSRGPALRLDPREMAALPRLERPYAYPLGAGLHPRAAGALPEAGYAVLSRDPGWPLEPGVIHAVRLGAAVELAPVLWNGSQLLVLPVPGRSNFVSLPAADDGACREPLRGRVVLIAS